jgi:putative ABC transport system permease protein
VLIVRSSLPFDAIGGAIRQRLAAYDPQLLVLRMRPMDALVGGALSRPRFNLLLLSSFAAVALVLSAVGIYGVLVYLVTQRTREIGIRMALGAQAGGIFKLVVGQGLKLTALGMGIGLACALAGTRLMSGLLYGMSALDVVTFAGVSLLLALVALLACYVPARRAAKVDPIVALRRE